MEYICPKCGGLRWQTRSKAKGLFGCTHCPFVGTGISQEEYDKLKKVIPIKKIEPAIVLPPEQTMDTVIIKLKWHQRLFKFIWRRKT